MRRFSVLFIVLGLISISSISSRAQRGIGGHSLILDDGSGHTVTIQLPGTMLGSYTWPLPITLGGTPSAVVPAGTTNNSTLRWDVPSQTWQENLNALVSSAGGGSFVTLTSNGAVAGGADFNVTNTSAGAGTQAGMRVNVSGAGATNAGITFNVGNGTSNNWDLLGTSSSWTIASGGSATFFNMINTPIGNFGASTGAFTTLSASSAVSGGADLNVTNTSAGAGTQAGMRVNVSGAGATNAGITFNVGNGTSNNWDLLGTSSSWTIASGGSATFFNIINTPIGNFGASTGAFTTLSASTAASGLVLGSGANATTLSSTASSARAISFPNAPGTLALSGAGASSQSSNFGGPTGTTSTTAVQMGYAGSITPTSSGKVLIIISGDMTNSTTADGASAQISYGTGAPPANGAAATGTALGTNVGVFPETAGGSVIVPFSTNAIVTGLTVGTTYWIDLRLAAITAGTASVSQVSISAIEMP